MQKPRDFLTHVRGDNQRRYFSNNLHFLNKKKKEQNIIKSFIKFTLSSEYDNNPLKTKTRKITACSLAALFILMC